MEKFNSILDSHEHVFVMSSRIFSTVYFQDTYVDTI